MIALLLLACGDKSAEEIEGLDILALSIEPEEVEVRTGPDGGEPVTFSVTATFENGVARPLEVVEWTISNRSVGELDEQGVFTPSAANGGEAWVTARLDNLDAQATLRVIYEDTLEAEEGLDADAFGEPGATLADAWLYPEDGVNLPRNTPSIRFQWKGDPDLGEAEAWRLELRSATTDLTVLTREVWWEADDETWQTVAATNAGGQVEVELTALLEDGTTASAAPLTVQVNRLDAEGSILYWSTSVEGFKEIPYGEAARDFYTAEDSGGCMGCHVIQGDRMAFTYEVVDGRMGLLDLESGEEIVPDEEELYGSFKAFSPDGELLLTTFEGDLLLYDGQTLDYRWQVPVEEQISHIDWSPDGRRLAAVTAVRMESDGRFQGGRIELMDHLGYGQFSAPELLYEPPAGSNAYYPAWSPDGEWIAFNVSTGDSYDDEDAQLMVIKAEIGAAPIALTAANLGEGLTNSWPRWGPLPDDDVFWLTFASRRPYGAITTDIPQIWVAAFDPERAAEGEDPSWPAFWLPSQETGENNHLPTWFE